jgi:thiazole synthase
VTENLESDDLVFGSYRLKSRVLLGTGKFPSMAVMEQAHAASGTEMITVAVRRVKFGDQDGPAVLEHIDRKRFHVLPNTAGCYTAKDAIRTARLAREVLETDLIKLEVIGDPKTLYPDNEATVAAAAELVKDGFTVMPYTSCDPVVCKRLQDVGCPVIMPLAAPIGSGLGVTDFYALRIILELATVPVIVDAGVGTASDITLAFEAGVDGVLLNTAVASARDPLAMAAAVRHAAIAGRLAFKAGRIAKRLYASASSPEEGLIAKAR